MKKNYLRRKISAMIILGALFLMTVSVMTVHAAVNPLAKMPTKVTECNREEMSAK